MLKGITRLIGLGSMMSGFSSTSSSLGIKPPSVTIKVQPFVTKDYVRKHSDILELLPKTLVPSSLKSFSRFSFSPKVEEQARTSCW
jgi:hypothetical protein